MFPFRPVSFEVLQVPEKTLALGISVNRDNGSPYIT